MLWVASLVIVWVIGRWRWEVREVEVSSREGHFVVVLEIIKREKKKKRRKRRKEEEEKERTERHIYYVLQKSSIITKLSLLIKILTVLWSLSAIPSIADCGIVAFILPTLLLAPPFPLSLVSIPSQPHFWVNRTSGTIKRPIIVPARMGGPNPEEGQHAIPGIWGHSLAVAGPATLSPITSLSLPECLIMSRWEIIYGTCLVLFHQSFLHNLLV